MAVRMIQNNLNKYYLFFRNLIQGAIQNILTILVAKEGISQSPKTDRLIWYFFHQVVLNFQKITEESFFCNFVQKSPYS